MDMKQLERILDEDRRPTIQVLVHMGGPADPPFPGEGPRRHPAMSAREVLPEPVRAARKAAIRDEAVPRLRAPAPGIRAAARTPGRSVDALRRSSQAALAPLLDRDAARRPGAARTFWVARCARLELDRDELPRLLADTPGIQAVYPDERVHLPPVARSHELPAAVLEDSAASWGLIRTGSLATWGAYGARGAGVTVGVLDTGVDASHPDLAGKVAQWAEFDATGEPVAGSEPHDTGSHGTHVCGTIAGGNASGQWIGMAPEAKLAVGLVLPQGSGTTTQILAGITWAVEQGVDVLNLSLGGAVLGPVAPAIYSEAFATCLRAGIPVVAAIGNEGAQTGGTTGSDFLALAVGATDHRDIPAGFSGGRTQVVTESSVLPEQFLPLLYVKPDVCAPGVAVTSAVPGGSWEPKDGTSMAAPHVSGAIALLLSAVPGIGTELSGIDRADFLYRQIAGSVDELGEAGHDARFGLGRLNALRAVTLAKPDAS